MLLAESIKICSSFTSFAKLCYKFILREQTSVKLYFKGSGLQSSSKGVEILFLSNPAEEELVLDPAFQQKMAEKIVTGVKDFLAGVGEE